MRIDANFHWWGKVCSDLFRFSFIHYRSKCRNKNHRTQYFSVNLILSLTSSMLSLFKNSFTVNFFRQLESKETISCLFYITKTRHDFVQKWRPTFVGAWKSPHNAQSLFRNSFSFIRINRYIYFSKRNAKQRIDKRLSAI